MKYKDAILAAGRECLSKALEESGGNVAKAAQMVGVKRQSLYRIMKRHGLHVEVKREVVVVSNTQSAPLGFNDRKWLK